MFASKFKHLQSVNVSSLNITRHSSIAMAIRLLSNIEWTVGAWQTIWKTNHNINKSYIKWQKLRQLPHRHCRFWTKNWSKMYFWRFFLRTNSQIDSTSLKFVFLLFPMHTIWLKRKFTLFCYTMAHTPLTAANDKECRSPNASLWFENLIFKWTTAPPSGRNDLWPMSHRSRTKTERERKTLMALFWRVSNATESKYREKKIVYCLWHPSPFRFILFIRSSHWTALKFEHRGKKVN